MELLLPTSPLDSNILSKCRGDVDFDDFFLAKFAYINRSSDLDVFQLQGNERINHLVCAWDTAYVLCRRCDAECSDLPDFLQNYITNLVHYSMSMWFSVEWEKCDFGLCCSLLVSMFRMRAKLMEIPCLAKLNWNYLMNIGVRPWQIAYFKEYMRVFGTNENSSSNLLTFSVESIEPPATIYDVAHINEEGLIITLLRLKKLFDAGCMESVKRFSVCAISAWNKEQLKNLQHEQCSLQNGYDSDIKRCLNLICHIHLMAVYEKDSAVGFEIDNMMNNIRFYHKCISDAQRNGKTFDSDAHQSHMTPSQLFAITCIRINQSIQDFLGCVLPDLSRESCSSLFGAVSHAYATYLLGSILVEMNKFNEEDFQANLESYKSTLRAYVVERERSERFILEEVHKQKLQGTCHNVTCTVKEITNFKTAIGKGNHSSNLVNHKPSDVQSEQERAELFETENEKRYDPVFQTMPNNEIVTNEFYDVLSKTKYKGWHFAKLVLLLKIIGRELNDIEKWCYHPGLTTEFMMTLEYKLAKRFEDLALIFQDHIFMEQEFWLTAFYLRPVRYYYDKVIYCGTRFFRTVNLLNKGDKDEVILKPTERSGEKSDEVSCAFMNAKYGLLSSTFDVKQIAQMTSVDTSENDYDLLAKALRMLRLPESIIKDLLTVTFSPRHANFTWAAEWSILRKRCKLLLTNPAYKRELVESNMAEANDRLKYLNVDYDKYKNWPQLDYGTIEEGYENDYIGDDLEDSDDDDDDFDEEPHKKKSRVTAQKAEYDIKTENPEDIEHHNNNLQADENPNEIDVCGGLRRISARRAAAVIASAMLKDDSNSSKLAKRKEDVQKPITTVGEDNTAEGEKKITENSAVESESQNTTINPVNDLFHYSNSTVGFVEITDIWSHKKKNKNQIEVSEQASSRTTFSIFKKIRKLGKKCNSENESDDSSGSDVDSFGQHSIHNAMNVSDTETSNSSDELTHGCWEELLPSFFVDNSTNDKTLIPRDVSIPLEKNNIESVKTDSTSAENDDEMATVQIESSVENANEMASAKTESISAENYIEMACVKTESNLNSQQETEQCSKINFLPPNKSGENNAPTVESKIANVPPVISTVGVLTAKTMDPSYTFVYEEKTANHVIAVAPADCTDTISGNNLPVDIKVKYESTKDDEFVVSTTTSQEDSVDILQVETETTIDSTACSKTEEHESIDEAASIETITEDDSSHAHKNEAEKVEVHSTTQTESNPSNKQLTGKPKSFSEILAAHLLNEDSSSQSSNGTQAHSTQCRGSITSEAAENDLEEKRKAELIELCLRRKCVVQLTRIQTKLPLHIREPIVRIKRLNMDKYLKEHTVREKRRTKTKPEFFYMEENSNPLPKSSRPRKRRNYTSEHSESDEEYTPKHLKESFRPANRKISVIKKALREKQERSHAKSFSIVPRSASGLKVCISSLCNIPPPTDCIEISSSSEGEVMEVTTFSLQFANISRSIADEDDPLFEEEADIELLR